MRYCSGRIETWLCASTERGRGAQNNPPYPPEFRREASRLVHSAPEERPISRIAREFRISAETLRNWVKQEEIDAGKREELRRLRWENKVLKEEKEILQKAG